MRTVKRKRYRFFPSRFGSVRFGSVQYARKKSSLKPSRIRWRRGPLLSEIKLRILFDNEFERVILFFLREDKRKTECAADRVSYSTA